MAPWTFSRGSKRIAWIGLAVMGVVIVTAAILTLSRTSVSSPTAGLASGAVEPEGSGRVGATPPPSRSPEERRHTYDAEMGGLRARISRTQELVDRFPRELVDLDALARSLPTSEAAFVFIRDRIAFEPYPGVMKGAVGTLTSRGGNTVDRAILLAAILARHGVTSRIARGPLPRAQAELLLRQIERTPDAIEQIADTVSGLRQASGVPDGEGTFAGALTSEAATVARTRHDQAATGLKQLIASLAQAGVSLGRDRRDAQLGVLEDHFWVQALIGGQQIDLDPSFTSASVNQRFTEPAETFGPDALPAQLYHRVQIRVIADVLENGAVTSRELVKSDARAIDLVERNIRLGVEPQGLARGQNAYRVAVTLGDQGTAEAAFEIRTAASPGPLGGAAGGLLGGLGSDEPAEPTPQNPSGAVLGRLAIEVVASAPMLGEARYRRVVMDRLDTGSQSPRLLADLESDDSIRMLLAQVWDGAIGVGASQPLQMFAHQLQEFTAQLPTTERALATVYLERPMDAEALGLPQLPSQLLAFFVYSSVTHHVVAATAGGLRSYQLRPRVAFYRHGAVVHDWSSPGGPRRVQDSIDLINMPYDIVGTGDQDGLLRLKIGVVDTALERALAGGASDFNTVPLVGAAGEQRIALLTVQPAGATTLDEVAVPAALRRVLHGELAAGRTLVVPKGLVALHQVRTYGWWSIDAESGVPLGQMELGAGQAVSETAGLNKALLTGSHTFSKFYGGMLGCFFVESADQLGESDGHPVTPTFSVSKGHYVPGLPTVVDGSHLAECLVERMCEAVIEYAFLAAESAAWLADLHGLQHHLVELLGLIGPTAVSTWMGACTGGGGAGGEH